ncbi:iron ABC transporter substrate-binding protein [Bradyrhizobium sp. OAE829]|uniref:iron ABC transporter substrate-binding protein n=1 Tax=Bradyrhizobium sp. OAE829 TaxID=2663807 RepID=UPI00178AD102
MIDRRTLLAGLSAAALIGPRRAFAATVRDAAGRAVPIPAKVARVFPAGPPAAILLYTLAPELLIGWPRANRAEECAYMLPDICARPEVGRITGRGNTANLETVLAAKPDLILDVGSTSATFVSLAEKVQEQTGIPYALLDGRFAGIAGTYRTLGELIGRVEDAEKLARYAEDTLKTILDRIAPIAAGERPKVYYARGPRGLSTGIGGSINVETIEMLGRNVAGGTQGGLANVSIEQVLVWNPDVIVTIDQEFAANVRSDPAWASVKAVRDNRVHLSPKMPFGWVDFPPSVNRLIGLWWLAKLLYPERFPEDLRALTSDFYSRFYHVTPTAAQIDHVLAGRD